VDILTALQKQRIFAEVAIGHSRAIARDLIARAEKEGADLLIVAGGDGTVSKMAAVVAGASIPLGIIPTGTHNNMALNLGIPNSIPGAVDVLRKGTPLRIDLADSIIGRKRRGWVETLTVGLWSDLLTVAGHQQHGDLSKLGELFATFVSASPFQFRLTLDGEQQGESQAHMVVVTNVPYIGSNLQIDPDVVFNDGLLDIFVFADISKLGLISYALRSRSGAPENGNISKFRAKHVIIETPESNNVMADGLPLGEAKKVEIQIQPQSLTVLAGSTRTSGPTPAQAAQLKRKK
jgi:diacylglycerol kinase family enzyme